jgi:hypothetical protein
MIVQIQESHEIVALAEHVLAEVHLDAAGWVLQMTEGRLPLGTQALEPAGARKATLRYEREIERIDVAAGQDEAHPAAFETLTVAQYGRNARGGGTFRDGLFDFEQHYDRLLDPKHLEIC